MQDNALPGNFLANCWQKRPLFVPAGLKPVAPDLSADELAWLATQDDVESRLVFTETAGGTTTYRLESGPFDDAKLGALPDRDWTLLVQDVDKHLPDFRRHFAPFSCIPDWRIDDLMISLAAPGGSVGPHRDHYDVFLVQGQGHREWRLGDAADAVDDGGAEGLSLLQPFVARSSHNAAGGDILYLPPGIPHWGIATDLCMTYSIGMRAPSRAELRVGAARVFDTVDTPDADDERIFYSDDDLEPVEAEPGRIHAATLRRVRAQQLLATHLDDLQMATIFGSVVTDPKAWLMPEPVAALPDELCVHGMARLAWYGDGDLRLVFANGAARAVSARECEFVRRLCRQRCSGQATTRPGAQASPGEDLLEWLRLEGIFDPGPAPE